MPLEPSIWDSTGLTPDTIRLEGRNAVVTGAARGIGEAIAVSLARFGADVAVCDRLDGELADTAAQIEALGHRAPVGVLDVRDDDASTAWMAEVAEDFDGRVDICVNNAGGGFHAPFLDVSPKGELALIRENFTSVTLFTRLAADLMVDGGSVINITSIEAHRAGPGFAVYSAMKAAVASLTQSLSMELAPRRIRVNCIAPDMIPTPGDAGLMVDSGALLDGVAPQVWPERGSVVDCAAAAVFLASDMARFITGTSLHLDGGNIAASGWKVRDDGGFAL